MPPAYGTTLEEECAFDLVGLNSDKTFATFVIHSTGSWPEAVTGATYTTDARTDAILSTSFDWDPANDQRLHLFGQTITGTLTLTQQVATGNNPAALAAGDLNRDGRPDVAIANQAGDTLGIFLQQAGGGLASMATYPAGDGPDGVAVRDFNGDLRDDVAVSHAVSQYVAVYHQQADGTFAEPVHLGVSSAGFNDIAAGDLNGDGYDDLVLLRGAGHQSLQVAVFYQQDRALGAPVFRTAEDGGFLAHGLAVGDVTGDGRDDVVVTAGGNTPKAYLNVFAQSADGSLAVAPTVYPAFHLPEAVEVGDVNHDGRNDVVNVHAAWMSLSVYTQTVTGTLSAYERYPLPYTDYYRPAGLALADVSSDGALDVLIASHSSLPHENGLVVLTNSGDAPTSTITMPASGVFITDTAVYAIQGKSSKVNATLEISTDGGRTWHTATSGLSWSYDWTVPITDGSYILLSRVTDMAGTVQAPPARSRAIVDHTPPVGSLLVDDDMTYTNVPTVTLSIDGSDYNDVGAMRFANQGSGYAAWIDFAPTYTWTLSGADGLKTVTGQVRDVPGNASAPFSDTIILDTTGPSCSLAVNGGDLYANSPQATLTLTSTDTYGVTHMRVRNAAGTWIEWQAYGTSLSWNLGSGDGTRAVEAQFRDVAGNASAVCTDTIILDTTPPTCGILVEDDATYAIQPTVSLTLNSSDTNGVDTMRFSDDGVTWSPWVSYSTGYSWTLPPPDGVKTVRAQFQDVAGNPSSVCNDTIILDTTPPTGFVIINGGALYTDVPAVSLTLGASDTYGVVRMRISNDCSSWDAWQSYATSAAWVLPPGDGIKTVCVQFEDTPGNVGGPFSDTIILDTTPPGGAILVNGGASHTNCPTVTLTITATDQIPVTEMRLSHDGTSWTPWEAYATARTWVLTDGDGVKTVYVEFRDAVGNTSAPIGDAIVLDTTAPGCQLFIDAGATYATQVTVTLNIACSDANPPIQVRYSNDGGTWSGWEAYSAVKEWSLGPGDGLRTVCLEAQDLPGNIGGPFCDTIVLDTTEPDCSLAIDGDAPFATTWATTLTITCTDTNGLNDIRLSDDGVSWGGWQPYVTSLPWTLPAGDGTKAVYMQGRDVPGNIAQPVSDTIILDTILPSGGCQVYDDNGYVNNPNSLLSLWSQDDNGVPDMQIRNAATAWGNWLPFATTHSWTLPSGDGAKTVECRFRDTPGNVSLIYSDTVVLDTHAPTCQIDVNGGVEYVNDILVTLVLSSTDAYGVDGMRFSADASSWTQWEPYESSRAWQLTGGDGPKTVWGQFRDPAYNTQQCNDDIILDTEPPIGTIVLADGLPYTAVPTISVTLVATDTTSGVDQVCLSDESTCTSWQPYAPSLEWLLANEEAVPQTVCAWFRDRAGNDSTAACDDIILDTQQPTGTIVLADGAPYTAVAMISVTLVATDTTSGVDQVCLSDTPTCSSWQPYDTTLGWTLAGGEGTSQTVCAWFRDGAGNDSTAACDDIILDQTPPTGSVVINDGAEQTLEINVTLTIEAEDAVAGVCEMRVRNADSAWESWRPFAAIVPWELLPTPGVQVVEVQLRDCVGNESASIADSIELTRYHTVYLPMIVRNGP